MTDLSIRLFVAMSSVMTSIKDSMHREEGQDLLEYMLLGGLVAAAIVAILIIFSPFLATGFTNIGKCIDFDKGTTCAPGF